MIQNNDPRSDEMKREMADCFATMEGEYRASDWANVVYEDDKVVLIEDTKGYEWGEWVDESTTGSAKSCTTSRTSWLTADGNAPTRSSSINTTTGSPFHHLVLLATRSHAWRAVMP